MIQHTYVGCDVSKAHVDLFDAATGQHERIANTSEATAAYLKCYEGHRVRVVFEATGR